MLMLFINFGVTKKTTVRENVKMVWLVHCDAVSWGGFLIVYKRASIVIRCSKGINGSGNWFAALKLVLLCMVGKLVLGLI